MPDVPTRQWVLAFPYELRLLLASNAKVMSWVYSKFLQVVGGWYRKRARELGLGEGRSGSVSGAHRAGGALNLNPHLHALFIDGVYTRADKSSATVFHPIPAPTKDDIERLCNQIVKSVVRMLRKRGLLVEEDQADTLPNTPAPESALHACRKISLSRGRYGSVRGQQLHLFDAEWTAPRTSKKHGLVANVQGFSLEASVHFGAHDRAGRERILKYCFRPPFSMDRLSVLRDGSVTYLTKYGRGARRHLILSKLEFLCRVASLIPPPKIPMVRYSGVLAPNSSYRASVVPKPC